MGWVIRGRWWMIRVEGVGWGTCERERKREEQRVWGEREKDC